MHERLLIYAEKISNILAKNSKFGIFDEDDIRQEIFILVHAGQKAYRGEKGDEFSFYFHFVKNRLKTLKRDNYFNPLVSDRESLSKLNNMGEIDESSKSYENTDIEDIDRADMLMDVVGVKIPANMRINYLKLLEGIELSYHDRVRLIGAIKNIVKANDEKIK